MTVLATQAAGATLVHDWLYELRLYSLEQMSGMGADLFLCDPHRIIVTGPRQLRGKQLDSRDIRSGMALIAAALAAKGQSRVDQLEVVERGYARLVERLQALGAQVARVELSGAAICEFEAVRRFRIGDRRTGRRTSTQAAPAAVESAARQSVAGCVGGGIGSGRRARRLAGGAVPSGMSPGGARRAGSGVGSGMSMSGAPLSRPTRNGCRSSALQIEHAHDPRRQRQDDVGLLRFALVVREEPADDGQVAQAGNAVRAPGARRRG